MVAFHGLRGGVGTTSLVAMVSDALHRTGQSVLMIDLNSDDTLRLHFNVPLYDSTGWAHAQFLDQPWNEHLLKITENFFILPFGRFGLPEELRHTYPEKLFWLNQVVKLKSPPQWVLLDIPGELVKNPVIRQLLDLKVMVASVDMSCHVLLFQEELDKSTRLLVNKQDPSRELCNDLLLEWKSSYQSQMVPVIIARDESVHEALALKSPVTQTFPGSIAAQQAYSLATWLALHMGQKR